MGDAPASYCGCQGNGRRTGHPQEQIVLIGPLDYVINPNGTLIYPYLGVIEDCQDITPNPAEVEEVFLAPLEYFLHNPPSKSTMEGNNALYAGLPLS